MNKDGFVHGAERMQTTCPHPGERVFPALVADSGEAPPFGSGEDSAPGPRAPWLARALGSGSYQSGAVTTGIYCTWLCVQLGTSRFTG